MCDLLNQGNVPMVLLFWNTLYGPILINISSISLCVVSVSLGPASVASIFNRSSGAMLGSDGTVGLYPFTFLFSVFPLRLSFGRLFPSLCLSSLPSLFACYMRQHSASVQILHLLLSV